MKKAKSGGAHSVVRKKTESVFSTQSSSSSLEAVFGQPFGLTPTQTCVDKDNGLHDKELKNDDKKEEDDEDDLKVELFVKGGKHAKIKYL